MKSTTIRPAVLNIDQAAARRGVSRTAIYSAITRKRLPRRYHRGSLVVRESDLEAWKQNKEKGGRPKGKPMSEEHKAKLREAYRRRQASRSQNPVPE